MNIARQGPEVSGQLLEHFALLGMDAAEADTAKLAELDTGDCGGCGATWPRGVLMNARRPGWFVQVVGYLPAAPGVFAVPFGTDFADSLAPIRPVEFYR